MSDHAQAGDLLRPDTETVRGWARRALDVAIALSALVLLAPLMVLIAAAIYAESGRPIFFSQTRLGRGGRHFRLHKYRKFSERAGRSGLAVTLMDDPRMTRVGRLLERTKLDEMPQLWNILTGEMSVVGPRPESLAFAECFHMGYRGVLDYKPGIFGPCQVIFRNENCLYQGVHDPEEFYRNVLFPLKAHTDLTYFRKRNMYSDLWWMVHGVRAVFGSSALPCNALPSVVELEARIHRVGKAGFEPRLP
jgi:lipopolysaccharide/colanic/teichoic acid biosynthesis glycosyltransferase